MKPKIDDKLINHLALLSRLELSDKEKESLKRNLSEILGYVDKLESLNTKDIKQLLHTMDNKNVFRPDEAKPGFSKEEALQNAPEKEAGFFKVPRVIE
jgi:aspartyl-tRNA(Asn)/glutamyl-tRNA(Gln) amidotransferase subunit C